MRWGRGGLGARCKRHLTEPLSHLVPVLKKVKHRLVENMSSGTADALGLSRAILCNGESLPPRRPRPRISGLGSQGKGPWLSSKAIMGSSGLALASAHGDDGHHLFDSLEASPSPTGHPQWSAECPPPPGKNSQAQVTDGETAPQWEVPSSGSPSRCLCHCTFASEPAALLTRLSPTPVPPLALPWLPCTRRSCGSCTGWLPCCLPPAGGAAALLSGFQAGGGSLEGLPVRRAVRAHSHTAECARSPHQGGQ